MTCSKCGKEFAEGVKFCTECGAELVAEAKEAVAEVVEEVVEAAQEEVKETAEEVVGAVTEAAGEVAEEVKETVEDAASEAEEVKEAVEEVAAEAEEVKETVEEVAQEEKKKKEKKAKALDLTEGNNGKKPVAIGLALVAILLLIFIPAVTMSSGDESYMKVSEKAPLAVEAYEGDVYAYYINGDEKKLDDEKATSQIRSMDGSVICYLNEEKELVLVKEDKVIKTGIDEAEGVVVSQHGDTLVYFTDCEKATYHIADYGYDDFINVGTLNLYDIKKKSSTEIAEEVVVGSAVLSPDGKTVAYVAEYDATDDFKGFYSVNGKKPEEVGKEKRVFAISDKGKYVYYSDVDRIYVAKKGEEEKLASDVVYVEVLMNADNTEMLFLNEGKTYVTVKGGEKKKVAGDELNEVVLNDDAASDVQKLTKERGNITVTYTGVDTFEGKLFVSDYNDAIYYMMNKYETEKLASNAYQYVVAEDGESLIYNDYTNLVKVTKFDKGGEKEIIAAGALAENIYADGDLKHVYMVNFEDELYYVKKGKGKKIADDVTSAMISPDGEYCYFVIEKEELCYSKKGGKEKELLTVEDGKLECKRESGFAIVGVTDEDKNTLYRMEGKKMKTVFEREVE